MVEIEALEDRIKLIFPQQCTIYQSDKIRDSLIDMLRDLSNEVEADLSNVDELDSSVVQIFISLKKTLSEDGRNIHFINPSVNAQRVFEVYNIDTYLK